MKRVVLLGSTGSIGRTTLRVMEELASTHVLVGVAAQRQADDLIAQARLFSLECVGVVDPAAAEVVRCAVGSSGCEVFSGPSAAAEVVRSARADIVINGIAGAAGLEASLMTLEAGIDLALANKESMVMAGPLLARMAHLRGARILPVDSEHSAIFQCLHREARNSLRKVILTASGGPFRSTPAEEMERATPEQALRHPTWKMGSKITIDSATLINKSLEVVEARWLFDLDPKQIEIVVHPQSIVHSMVEFVDGSILAQMGVPDMAVPIRFALAYPDRAPTADRYFDLRRFAELTFEEPDFERFPGLELGFIAAHRGGTAGAILNAANEVAVDQFLAGRVSFGGIARVVGKTLERLESVDDPDLEQILAADKGARLEALACCH